ncbi:hypothetical protein [Novosphingobium naphthalenivorans]|uniref:hypothetical protein n=1 Tax=Novosphingobium naphthalenivorans TaxID=273168 RepID=UPI0012EE0DCB|nr:hypothetical protein [Novosphingobium naphthalenivorans]
MSRSAIVGLQWKRLIFALVISVCLGSQAIDAGIEPCQPVTDGRPVGEDDRGCGLLKGD